MASNSICMFHTDTFKICNHGSDFSQDPLLELRTDANLLNENAKRFIV